MQNNRDHLNQPNRNIIQLILDSPCQACDGARVFVYPNTISSVNGAFCNKHSQFPDNHRHYEVYETRWYIFRNANREDVTTIWWMPLSYELYLEMPR